MGYGVVSFSSTFDGLECLYVYFNSGNCEKSVSLDEILPPVLECLMSHSHVIRLGILSLLKSSMVDCANDGGVIDSLVAVEAIPIGLQGARERAVRTVKVVKAVEGFSTRSAELCARWLVGQ